MRNLFETGVQTNAFLVSMMLMALQIYILWELNGHLVSILTTGCLNPLIVATIFAPTMALVYTLKTFAGRSGNYKE